MNKILILIFLNASFSAFPQDNSGYLKAVSLRGNVVLIKTDKVDGVGLIVAVRNEKAYIVTAKHVVDGASAISLLFHNTFERVPATNLNLTFETYDVALLSAIIPKDHKWISTCYCESEVGASVWFIGRNSEWYIPVGSAVGAINRFGAGGKIYLDQTSVLPGTSGAPLITKEGILGIIVEDQIGVAIALHIKTIKEIITDEWRYPFDLKQCSGSSDRTSFTGKLDLSSTVSFGGPPFCRFTMRNENIKIKVKLSSDRKAVESAIVSFQAREKADDGCPYQTVPLNTHTYTMETSSLNNNKLEIEFVGDNANNPKCSLVLHGTLDGDKIIANLENKRIDLPQEPSLIYNLKMDVQLEATDSNH